MQPTTKMWWTENAYTPPAGELVAGEKQYIEPQIGLNATQEVARQGFTLQEPSTLQYSYAYKAPPPQELCRTNPLGYPCKGAMQQFYGALPNTTQMPYSAQMGNPAQVNRPMDICPQPLSRNFHPQELVPRRGYSNFFPPDQHTEEQERIKQLEEMLDASINRQQRMAADNKTLKNRQSRTLLVKGRSNEKT